MSGTPHIGLDPADGPDHTVRFCELRELTELARLGLEMRKAQRAYFELRRTHPHGDHRGAYQHARQLEAKFDAAAREALKREQQVIPGMGAEG